MFDALNIAATGMLAQQTNVDAIANNLANVNTIGFKRARVGFIDLMTRFVQQAPLEPARPLGAGVAVSRVERLVGAGEIKKTDQALDIAISGEGFLEVTASDGGRAFTRGGSLGVDADGLLTSNGGLVLKPTLSLPQDAQDITITLQGQVFFKRSGSGIPVEAGTLEMVNFVNPAALTALGGNLYRGNDAAGEAFSGRAGEDGMGTVRQGFLEASNVRLVDEMIGLMLAQRAYEASVKVAQASDEMLGMVNGLRK